MEPVLIIDDELEVCELLTRFLRIERFPVECALTGRDGLRLMEEKLFNLVILDIRLPDYDGTEMIKRLKDVNPLCNIVMITGFASMDYLVACLGGGAVDYFTKPFQHTRDLVEVMRELDRKIKRWKTHTPLVAR